jgi:hypothetical protein
MGSGLYPYTQESSLVIMVFMKSESLFVESSRQKNKYWIPMKDG